jgi:hypothetical protein
MKCQACEEGDHDNCGMQTWCDCDCEGYDPGGTVAPVFTHCNVCGKRLREPEEDEMGMCNDCGNME